MQIAERLSRGKGSHKYILLLRLAGRVIDRLGSKRTDLSFLTDPGIDQCRDVDYCTWERVDASSTTVGRMRGRELCGFI